MFEQVQKLLVEYLNCQFTAVTLEARLAEDLEVDSLFAIEMAVAIEEELGIMIPDEELGQLKTVRDLVEYLEKNQMV